MRGREHTPSGVQKANKENKKIPLKQYVPELLDLWGSLNNDVDKRRLECSTCPRGFGCWELSHVIFLMLRKKELLAKLSKLQSDNYFH